MITNLLFYIWLHLQEKHLAVILRSRALGIPSTSSIVGGVLPVRLSIGMPISNPYMPRARVRIRFHLFEIPLQHPLILLDPEDCCILHRKTRKH